MKAQTSAYGGNIRALTEDDTYVYAGGDVTYKVYQYWKSNMTKKAEADYGGYIVALADDDTYVYAGGETTNKVYQYYKSNMTKKAETASYGGAVYALAEDDNYVYAGGSTTNKVYQYYKSDMTKKAETISYGDVIFALDDDATYVYAAGWQTVNQYWKSNMTKRTNTVNSGGTFLDVSLYVDEGDGEILTPGTTYYYQAWSYNATDDVWSSLNASDSNTTDDDLQPILSSPDPSDGAPNIDKNMAQVSINMNDPEGDMMSYLIHGIYLNNVSSSGNNGTKTATLITPLPYGTVITWYVNATDGYKWTNATYTFTVRDEFIADPPTDFTAVTVDRFQIDLDWTPGAGADKTVIVAKLGSAPSGIGDGTIIYNGTGTGYSDDGLGPSEHWYYIAYSWNQTDEIYSLTYDSADDTTEGNTPPGPFSSEDPEDEADYESVYHQWLNVTVTDNDADSMTVYFYWGNGTAIAFDTIASGGTASIYLPDYITPDWLKHQDNQANYTWYAIANDTYDDTQSSTWLFITSYAWDVNEDRSIDYLDVSGIVGVYGNVVIAGSIGADVIEDGEINYLDASSFVSHYGETY